MVKRRAARRSATLFMVLLDLHHLERLHSHDRHASIEARKSQRKTPRAIYRTITSINAATHARVARLAHASTRAATGDTASRPVGARRRASRLNAAARRTSAPAAPGDPRAPRLRRPVPTRERRRARATRA